MTDLFTKHKEQMDSYWDRKFDINKLKVHEHLDKTAISKELRNMYEGLVEIGLRELEVMINFRDDEKNGLLDKDRNPKAKELGREYLAKAMGFHSERSNFLIGAGKNLHDLGLKFIGYDGINRNPGSNYGYPIRQSIDFLKSIAKNYGIDGTIGKIGGNPFEKYTR